MNSIIEMRDRLKGSYFFANEIASNTVYNWFTALVLFLVLYISIRVFYSSILKFLIKAATKSENQLDNLFIPVFASVKKTLLAVAAFCIAANSLVLPEKIRIGVNTTLVFAVLLQLGISGSKFFDSFFKYLVKSQAQDPAKSAVFGLVGYFGRVLVWVSVSIIFFDHLGININGLVAGLGVGGIAVALAVQNILGDLLSSLSIILDKPFKIGDFIVVGDMLGTVEKIGIKSTRLKSISGEQLVVSNSDLLSSRIRNFQKMYERRVVFEVGVTYQTLPEQLKAINSKIKETIDSLEDVRFDRCHFKKFADSALVFEIVYFVLSSDYLMYMDRQQEVNMRIFNYFSSEGIEFAYPTQTVFLEKGNA